MLAQRRVTLGTQDFALPTHSSQYSALCNNNKTFKTLHKRGNLLSGSLLSRCNDHKIRTEPNRLKYTRCQGQDSIFKETDNRYACVLLLPLLAKRQASQNGEDKCGYGTHASGELVSSEELAFYLFPFFS